MKKNTIEFAIGNVLKKLREDGNHKLITVEMETGICKSKLSKIECGRQLVDFETLYILCVFYNVSMGMVLLLVENNLGSLPQPIYRTTKKVHKQRTPQVDVQDAQQSI
jgi:transcriptional regulator with XRE-family HTH domain